MQKKVYKVSMFTFGGLVCGIPVLIVEMIKGSSANIAYEYFCDAFLVGGIVLGTCLVYCGMALVSAFLSACAGAVVGVGSFYLLSGGSGPILKFIKHGSTILALSGIGAGLVGGLIGYYGERYIVICLTSAVGSVFCLLAWDCAFFGWQIDPLHFALVLIAMVMVSCHVQCFVTGRKDDRFGDSGEDDYINEHHDVDGRRLVGRRKAVYVHPRDRPLLPTCDEVRGYCGVKSASRALREPAPPSEPWGQALWNPGVQQGPRPTIREPTGRPRGREQRTDNLPRPSSFGLDMPLLSNESESPSDQMNASYDRGSPPADTRGAFWGRAISSRTGNPRAFQTHFDSSGDQIHFGPNGDDPLPEAGAAGATDEEAQDEHLPIHGNPGDGEAPHQGDTREAQRGFPGKAGGIAADDADVWFEVDDNDDDIAVVDGRD